MIIVVTSRRASAPGPRTGCASCTARAQSRLCYSIVLYTILLYTHATANAN